MRELSPYYGHVRVVECMLFPLFLDIHRANTFAMHVDSIVNKSVWCIESSHSVICFFAMFYVIETLSNFNEL